MSIFYRIIDKIRRMLPLEQVLVIGDSHVLVFNHPLFKRKMPFFLFNVISVPGATASGLINPNSKTQAYKIFRTHLDKEKYEKIVLCLGEVDTGFVIWYRAKKNNDSVECMLNQAIENYTKLILVCEKRARTIVISAPLPTIDDDSDLGKVANLRKTIDINQEARTKLTVKFNAEVEAICKKNDVDYVNLDLESINEDGIVTPDLISQDDTDHHYSSTAYAGLLVKSLKMVM